MVARGTTPFLVRTHALVVYIADLIRLASCDTPLDNLQDAWETLSPPHSPSRAIFSCILLAITCVVCCGRGGETQSHPIRVTLPPFGLQIGWVAWNLQNLPPKAERASPTHVTEAPPL